MATARLIPSTNYLSNSSYLKVTNPSNMYANTDSTNYATVANSQTGTTSYYIYLRGFNFSSIPEDAIVNSFTIKLKANMSGGSTSTSYRPVICNGTSALTCTSSVITTTVATQSFSGITADWETIKGYGSNFGIRINCRRNNRNTAANFYIYGAEILVDYTVPVPHTITTSATGCTITPSGTTTLYEGNNFSCRIEADRKPTLTDNGVDVSDLLEEHTSSLEYTVEQPSEARYGFELNANGYYESKNYHVATSCALAKVSFDLPVQSTITFTVINYAEATYDYGLLSNVNQTLSNSASADTSNVYWNGKNNNSSSPQEIYYTVEAGSHFIYVKYFKDSYTDSNNDTLQFKVTIEPNEPVPTTVFWVYNIEAVYEDHVIVASMSSDSSAMYIKLNGVWRQVTPYEKRNGSWVQITNLSTIDRTKNYVVV